jgi:hypothetical protein
MNNIPENFDKSDPSHIKIVGIQADKKFPLEIPFKGRILSSKTVTKLAIFLKIQEKIENFFTKKELFALESELFSYLKILKKELELLSQTNVSQEISFCEKLSKNWRLIIDFASEHNDELGGRSYLNQLKALIEKVHKYPENRDHTLGYYLTKFIDGDWLPFPFMEILEHLHEESLLSKEKSTLSNWIKKIEDILYASS